MTDGHDPDPGSQRASSDPRTDLVRSIFAATLSLPWLAADDNFFRCGGHSLMAATLIKRLRSAFGVQLSVRDLFDAPTPAGVTQKLDAYRASRQPVGRMPRPAVLPVSFAQRRMWFLNQVAGGGAGYNIPIALWLSGELDRDALRLALADLVTRHEALRTIFPALDGVPTQKILDPVDAASAMPVVPVEPDEAADLVRLYAAGGFDLTADLPMRVFLFALGAREHVLLLLIHHIAVDGWSFEPLSRDLSAAYTARLAGHDPAWPELPVQYADFTLWQHEQLSEDRGPDSLPGRQLRYWLSQLENLPEQLSLPADRPRPTTTSYRGGRVRFRLDTDLHRRLSQLGQEMQVSLFMLLHAALAVLLTRLGAGTDVPIGAPIAGRSDEALDDLIGFFVNTLVLRTDTSGDPSFRDMVERTRRTDLAAFDAPDIPFERLVEALNPARSLGVRVLPSSQATCTWPCRGSYPVTVPRAPGVSLVCGSLTCSKTMRSPRIACDISASMRAFTGPVASAAWILARAACALPAAAGAGQDGQPPGAGAVLPVQPLGSAGRVPGVKFSSPPVHDLAPESIAA
jgi:hypothetical protein